MLNQATESMPLLVCEAGAHLIALPIEHVIETMRPLPVDLLHRGAPRHDGETTSPIEGLSIIRGKPVPIVDTGRLLEGRPLASWGRFVTVRAGARSVALAVGAVLGVRRLAASSIDELPPLLGDHATEATRMGALDAKLLVVLQTSRVVPEPTWNAIERHAT